MPSGSSIVGRRPYRVSLLAVAAALMIVAVALVAWQFESARRQQRGNEQVMRMDGWCGHDYESDNGGPGESQYPPWLIKFVGRDTLHRVVRVHFPDYPADHRYGDLRVTNDRLACLKDLPYLRFLGIYHPQINDDAIVHLAALKRLEYVNIWVTSISDAGVERLQTALPGALITRERPVY